MNNIQQYYNKTKSNEPKKNVKYIIEAVKPKPGKAIDLGCGAGNETVYLIKNNWNVTAIDRENVKERIEKRLTEEEQKRFKFQNQKFEELNLEENNLTIANYSLPFCNKNKFNEMWEKIADSIMPGGYFVGNFFGLNDEWVNTKTEATFLSKEQVLKLFERFEVIKFKEIENDSLTGAGKMKHWHLFHVIARKI